jgi:hypothetical protein
LVKMSKRFLALAGQAVRRTHLSGGLIFGL